MKVFVTGAGTMGVGIAQTFAEHGNEVFLYDMDAAFPLRGIAAIAKNLDRNVEKGRMDALRREEVLKNVVPADRLELASQCELVVEAIVENMAAKHEVFDRLRSVCAKDTIFASNTSSLSITELASKIENPERVVGMHFFNPVPVMKLVEVVKGMKTSEETCRKVIDIAVSLEKEPVEISDSSGFIVNRILTPMMNEAVCMLVEGVASRDDIDKAMRLGANHPIGPLALADLIGIDTVLAIMLTLYNDTKDTKYRPHPYLKKMVDAGYLGRKVKQGFYTY